MIFYDTGFNRYIVECKDNNNRKRTCRQIVLIDTQWNVKKYNMLWDSQIDCFNRYIVECKDTGGTPFLGGLPSFNRYIVECKEVQHVIGQSD